MSAANSFMSTVSLASDVKVSQNAAYVAVDRTSEILQSFPVITSELRKEFEGMTWISSDGPKKLISAAYPEVLMNIIQNYTEKPAETLALLRGINGTQLSSITDVLWKLPLLKSSKERVDQDLLFINYKPKVTVKTNIRCGKCRSSNIIFMSKQTRSSDEPETTFAQCADCNNKWRTSG